MPDFLNFGALKDDFLGWIEVHIDTLKICYQLVKLLRV